MTCARHQPLAVEDDGHDPPAKKIYEQKRGRQDKNRLLDHTGPREQADDHEWGNARHHSELLGSSDVA